MRMPSVSALQAALKTVAKNLLPPVIVSLYQFRRCAPPDTDERRLGSYLRGGKIPWSEGYETYKKQFIVGALSGNTRLDAFTTGAPLPPQYGVGIDERCIEYPWLFSHLPSGPLRLLDAGGTLNHVFILDHPKLKEKLLHILTLAPEAVCSWDRGISYLFADLRDIPVRDNYYDAVTCLSTLEHVGCDNSVLTGNARHQEGSPEDFLTAVSEMRRVLRPGGTLYLTVPFGVRRYFRWFQQFDEELLAGALEAFGAADQVACSFYRYTIEGWRTCSVEECRECKYVEWYAEATGGAWPNVLPVEPDLAAAARAVACVRISKH